MSLRSLIFHMAHPSGRVTGRQMQEKIVWLSMATDIARLATAPTARGTNVSSKTGHESSNWTQSHPL